MNIQKISSENRLFQIAIGVSIIWVIAQIILIIYFWGVPQGSDMGTYIKIAQDCFEMGEWYPTTHNIYSQYIWAPGFVNYLILQLKIFGTVNLNSIFNLLMNIIILYEVYLLGKHFFSNTIALLAVILFCLLYSNTMVVLSAGTELPFLFLSLSGLCLVFFSKSKIVNFIFAGILFALANWIRPLVIIFVIAALTYMFLKKQNILSYLSLLLSIIIIVLIIGFSTYNKIGYFVYQSTTSGVNLIMTANDKAYGGVMSHVFKDSTSTMYINEVEKLTFIERDSIYKSRAIEWIKENPVRFAFLYVKKIAGLYIEDSWADRPILGGDGFIGKYATGEISKSEFILRAFHMLLGSIAYYIVIILFIISLWINRRKLLSERSIVLLIFILGTAITILFAVTPRYHHPFMFVMVLYAAWGLVALEKHKVKHKNNYD